MHKNSCLISVALCSLPLSANAATLVNEDFESGIPSWTLYDNNSPNNAGQTMNSATGHIGGGVDGGFAAQATGGMSNLDDSPQGPGALFIAPTTIDSGFDFTVTADIWIPSEGDFDDSGIFLGDFTGPGGFYHVLVTEVDANNDLFAIDANGQRRGSGNDGTPVGSTDGFAAGLADETWYSTTLTYTAGTQTLAFDISVPGGASLGSFSEVLDGSGSLNPALTSAVQVGFGSHNDSIRFDNVVINGTAIPEPGSSLLALAGALGLLARRRRSA